MNTILKHFIKISLMLVLLLQAGKVEAQTCTGTPLLLSGTINGVTVTSTKSSDVTTYGSYSNASCSGTITMPSSVWLGNPTTGLSDSYITYNFSVPVNDVAVFFAAVSGGEVISFTANAGTVTAQPFNYCGLTQTGNSFAPSGGNGGVGNTGVVIHSTVSYTSLTIRDTNGPTYQGTLVQLCSDSIIPCSAGATAPTLSATTIANNCTSSNSVNLNSLVATTPTGASLQWFSDNTHTNAVTTPTAVTSSGTYYAFYYDATHNCYSPVSAAVTATLTACCPTASPTVN